MYDRPHVEVSQGVLAIRLVRFPHVAIVSSGWYVVDAFVEWSACLPS